MAQIRSVQLAVELGLPCQDDLQQLAVAILQIPQQADLFEHFPFEVVRFVDDQHDGPAVLRLLDQQLIEREQHFSLGGAGARQIKIVGDHLEKLLDVNAGVKEKGEFDVLGFQVVAQALEHGRFARCRPRPIGR